MSRHTLADAIRVKVATLSRPHLLAALEREGTQLNVSAQTLIEAPVSDRPAVMKRLVPAVVAVTLLAVSCSEPGVPGIPEPGGGPSPSAPVPPVAADQPTPAADPPDDDFPKPNQEFAVHFADPLYYDEGEELAPFGSDEGSDTLWIWTARRSELTTCTTLRWMIEQDDVAGALDDPSNNGPDVDGFIIGAGFTLLLFTGHIDTEGKELVLDALHRTYSYYADMEPREPAVMLRDLQRFSATDCTKP